MNALIQRLKAFVMRMRLVLILCVFCASMAMAGTYGWKIYSHRQKPEFAVDKLKSALLPPSTAELLNYIDFRPLAENLAQHMLATRPQQTAASPHAIALLAEEIQRQLQKALEQTKNDKPQKIPADAPLASLPDNFIAQLASKLYIQSRKDNHVFLRADIEYPRAERTFPLILRMEPKGDHKWMVTKIVNAQELLTLFAEAEAHLQTQRDEAFAEKNAHELRRMNAQLQITSCVARPSYLSERNNALLVIEAMGRNTGNLTIHNLNFLVTITSPKGERQLHVNLARRIMQGETFRDTWTRDLDPHNESDKALLDSPDITCTVSPHAMTLSSGEVLYIRPTPNATTATP